MNDQISDEQIEIIAKKIEKKNWEKLAFKLGFLEYDIDTYKAQNRNDTHFVITQLLREWRDQDPYLATASRLKRYLEDCGMIDAAIVFD